MADQEAIARALKMVEMGTTITAAARLENIPRKTLSDHKAKRLGTEKLLIIPDTHAPYHDRKAWELVMKVGAAFKPDIIVHLGDLADCYALSFHSKDPARKSSWKSERNVCRTLRGEMDDLGAGRKLFIEGNHENRLPRYLWEKAPALAESLTMDEELRLSENGWELTPYKDHARIGKVYFTHDTGGGGKYSTGQALDTFQHSVVIGHHHSIQYQVKGDAVGQHQVGAQFGWLGDIEQVDYMHKIKVKRNWAPGFGIGHHDLATGYVYLTPIPIVEYTACVEGRIYR